MGQSTIRGPRSHRNLKPLSVKTKSLLSIVSEAGLTSIDALKIDVEGAEDIVLRPFLEHAPSHLWPEYIIIEPNRENWSSDVIADLKAREYHEVMDTGRNLIMEKSSEPE